MGVSFKLLSVALLLAWTTNAPAPPLKAKSDLPVSEVVASMVKLAGTHCLPDPSDWRTNAESMKQSGGELVFPPSGGRFKWPEEPQIYSFDLNGNAYWLNVNKRGCSISWSWKTPFMPGEDLAHPFESRPELQCSQQHESRHQNTTKVYHQLCTWEGMTGDVRVVGLLVEAVANWDITLLSVEIRNVSNDLVEQVFAESSLLNEPSFRREWAWTR